MADAEARFAINIDTAAAEAAGAALGSNLERLKEKITQGSKALQDMQGAAQRLRASADVLRFEEAGKGLQKAQADVAKFESRIDALRQKLSQTGNAKAANGLQAQIADAQKGLVGAQDRVKSFAAKREKLGQSDAVKAYKDVTAAIKEKQSALAGAQTELTRMGGSLTSTAESAGGAAEGTGLFAGQLSKLKALGPAGVLLAIAAAAVAVTVAFGRGVYAVLSWITQISDAARTAQIFNEATAGSVAGGEALASTINRVYQRVGGARGEIQQLALDLRRLGLEGQALENSVEAVSAASRVFGASSGAAIKGLIDRAQMVRRGVLSPLELRGTGLAFNDVAAQIAKNFRISLGAAGAALRNGQVKVEDFTRALRDATRAKTGEALKQLALSLPEQFARAKDNVEQIFKIDPSKMLGGIHSVLGLLDETTETGKTLRALMKTVFQPIIDFVGSKIFPLLRGMVLGVVAAVLELAIFALDLAIAFKKILPDDFGKNWDLVEIGFWAGVAVVGALVGVLGGLALAFALTTVALIVLSAAIWMPIVAVWGLILVIKKLISSLFGGEEGKQAGGSLVDGIIDGITSRAGALFKAIASLATGGLLSFNDAAKIHSPSELYKPSGRFVAEGVAEGVEEGAPRVSGAVAGLADPTVLDAAGAGGAPRNGASAAGTVHITIDARGSSPEAVEEKRSLVFQLVEVLEGAIRQAGGVPPRFAPVEVLT